MEEREDDCPHLRDCFYHHPLHCALCHWCHPLSNLGSPSRPALLFRAALHGGCQEELSLLCPSPQGMLLDPLAPDSEALCHIVCPREYLGSLEGESWIMATFHGSSKFIRETQRAQHVSGTLMVTGRQ